MPRHPRISKLLLAAGALAVVVLGTSSISTAATPPALECAPIACAAAYIGVPERSLATDIANEARRTGIIGTAVALDQLDTALSLRLTTASGGDVGAALDRWSAITIHDAIRDLLLTQAYTGLRSALGG